MSTSSQKIKPQKKVGSVLVVGGGIGGMQTSLDLANIGFKVYLVDKRPSIGGRMSQLDKTFPTNDCSMCILSPKLVDIARHPNIELMTYSEVKNVKGNIGNYSVTVNKKARSIDEEKCTSCELCTKNCPVLLQPQIQKKSKSKPKVQDEKYLNDLISKYSTQKSPLIQIMIEINNKYRYLPKDILHYLSYKLGIPLSLIYQVATFYKAFSLEPRGKYHIKICLGTACHVRGVSKIVDKVKSHIDSDKKGLFSLETVNCLGACALGPVMVVNDEVHGHMTVDKVDRIIDSLEDN
jgi:NADH:ubiquinone oxidoreductase subunit E